MKEQYYQRRNTFWYHFIFTSNIIIISKNISKREAVIIWILPKITGITESKIRYEQVLRCGPLWPAWNFTSDLGPDGECDPNSPSHCCSPSGFCGFSDEHCKCEGCIDFRITNPSNSKLCHTCIHTPIRFLLSKI